MKRREFLVHLISELSSFLLQGQPRKMVISLHQEADGIHLAVIDDRARSEVEIKAIERALNASRRPELAAITGGWQATTFWAAPGSPGRLADRRRAFKVPAAGHAARGSAGKAVSKFSIDPGTRKKPKPLELWGAVAERK